MGSLQKHISEQTLLLKKQWDETATTALPHPIYRKVTGMRLGIPDWILMHLAPEKNSLLWVIINASQVLLSVLLLLALLRTMGNNNRASYYYYTTPLDNNNHNNNTTFPYDYTNFTLDEQYLRDQLLLNEEYVVARVLLHFDAYDLLTTFVWIVEIGTSVWLTSRNRDRLTYLQAIELLFACLFVLHSLFSILSHTHRYHKIELEGDFNSGGNHSSGVDNTRSGTLTTTSNGNDVGEVSLNRRYHLGLDCIDIIMKTIAYSVLTIMFWIKWRSSQEEVWKESAWWDEISMGGTTIGSHGYNSRPGTAGSWRSMPAHKDSFESECSRSSLGTTAVYWDYREGQRLSTIDDTISEFGEI